MGGELAGTTALLIGAGSLGGPAALGLAAEGVGRLLLVDGGAVEQADLASQPLFGEADLGLRKAPAAARALGRRFRALAVEGLDLAFDPQSAGGLVARADVVVDATGHLPTMFAASDAAVAAGRPLVRGGLLHLTAQLCSVVPGQTACLRCLFEGPPPPGAVPAAGAAGVLGPLAALAGSLLAVEAARLLAGRPGAYAGRLLIHDGRTGGSRLVSLHRRAGCPACGGRVAGGGPAADEPAVSA